MLLTLYSLPEILFLKRHGLKGLYSWGVSWGVAYVPTMQLKKLATMVQCSTESLFSYCLPHCYAVDIAVQVLFQYFN